MHPVKSWRSECPSRTSRARRRLLGYLGGSLGAAVVSRLANAEAPPTAPIYFGVFPYLPALEIGRQFGPMASALAEVLGRPVSLQTKNGFPDFRTALHEARYDVVLLHPFLYGDVSRSQDYRPLARLRDNLAGVVVAHAERPMASFADLRGQTIAVPPALSAVAQLVESELRRAGLNGPDGVKVASYRTKNACLHAVVTGEVTACALPGFALSQIEAFAPVALEGKFQTASIPGILFAGHGRLGDTVLTRLERALVGWNHAPDGRRMLAQLGWSGLISVRPGDYDMAELRLSID